MSKHTPLPWKAQAFHIVAVDCGSLERDGYNDHCVVDRCDGRTAGEAKANAEFIVRACNAYGDLLAALEECVTDDNAQCIVTCDVAFMIRRFLAINEIARAAIAKATEDKS